MRWRIMASSFHVFHTVIATRTLANQGLHFQNQLFIKRLSVSCYTTVLFNKFRGAWPPVPTTTGKGLPIRLLHLFIYLFIHYLYSLNFSSIRKIFFTHCSHRGSSVIWTMLFCWTCTNQDFGKMKRIVLWILNLM